MTKPATVKPRISLAQQLANAVTGPMQPLPVYSPAKERRIHKWLKKENQRHVAAFTKILAGYAIIPADPASLAAMRERVAEALHHSQTLGCNWEMLTPAVQESWKIHATVALSALHHLKRRSKT